MLRENIIFSNTPHLLCPIMIKKSLYHRQRYGCYSTMVSKRLDCTLILSNRYLVGRIHLYRKRFA